MTRASFLPYEIQSGRSDRRGKRAKKGEYGLQIAAAFDHEAELRRAAAHLASGETRARAGRVGLHDQHTHALKPGKLRRAGDVLRDREPLVAEDAEIANFHPCATPRNRFRGDGGPVPAAPVGEGGERRFGLTERGAPLETGARRPQTSPGKNRDAEDRSREPRHGRSEANAWEGEIHRSTLTRCWSANDN